MVPKSNLEHLNHVPVALFCFPIIQFYLEMAPVLNFFLQKKWKVYAILGWYGESADKIRQELEGSGVLVLNTPKSILFSEFGSARRTKHGMNDKKSHREKRKISVLNVQKFISTFYSIYKTDKMSQKWSANMLDRINPNVIFDGPYWGASLNQTIGSEASQRSILYCHLPVFATMGLKVLQLHLRHQTKSKEISLQNYMLLNIARYFFPKSFKYYKGEYLAAHHPIKLAANYLSGNYEPDPWNVPSKYFDIYFVESESSIRPLVSENYDEDKFQVVGKPSQNSELLPTKEKLREDIQALYGLDVSAGFILVYFPPLGEHAMTTMEKHTELFDKFLSVLSNLGKTVLFSPHPSSDKNYYFEKLSGEPNFALVTCYRLVHLLPFASLAVMPFPSTTSSMFENREMPAVLFDLLGFSLCPEFCEHERKKMAKFEEAGISLVYDFDELKSETKNKCETRWKTLSEVDYFQYEHLASENIYKTVVENLSWG